jgi:biotin transport system permease protein
VTNFNILGAYRPDSTLVHRAPAWSKLLVLILGAIAATSVRTVTSTIVALVIVLILSAIARIDLKAAAPLLMRFFVLAALLFAFHVLRYSWQSGFAVVGTLFSLTLAATVLTTTTSADEMLGTISAMLRPLRRFGVKSESVALAFSLAMRSIPEIIRLERETADAARARGLERSARARTLPLMMRVIAHALKNGEAVTSRNI